MKGFYQRRGQWLAADYEPRRPQWVWVLLMRVALPVVVCHVLGDARRNVPEPLSSVMGWTLGFCAWHWLTRIVLGVPIDLWRPKE